MFLTEDENNEAELSGSDHQGVLSDPEGGQKSDQRATKAVARSTKLKTRGGRLHFFLYFFFEKEIVNLPFQVWSGIRHKYSKFESRNFVNSPMLIQLTLHDLKFLTSPFYWTFRPTWQ